MKNKKGMTGIETAIILIAFVIAASVFAFAVLNMGLIATQRAQEAVGAGLQQASSSLLLDTLVCKGGTGSGSYGNFAVDNITILVKIAPGQSPCDFNQTRMTISFKNNYTFIANIYTMATGDFAPTYDETYNFNTPVSVYVTTPALCTIMVLQGNGNAVLEAGETFAIMVNLVGIQGPSPGFSKPARLNSYDQFLVDIMPSIGAKLTVMARVPVSITPVMTLLTGGPA